MRLAPKDFAHALVSRGMRRTLPCNPQMAQLACHLEVLPTKLDRALRNCSAAAAQREKDSRLLRTPPWRGPACDIQFLSPPEQGSYVPVKFICYLGVSSSLRQEPNEFARFPFTPGTTYALLAPHASPSSRHRPLERYGSRKVGSQRGRSPRI